jgi:outer membrane protein
MLRHSFHLLLAITLVPSVHGEFSDELSFERAAQLMTQHNPEYQISTLRLQSSGWLIDEAQGRHLPTISARLGLNRQGDNSPDSQDRTSYSAGLDLRQNLFSGLSDSAAIEAAKADRGLAQFQHQRLLNRLERDLRIALANYSFSYRAVPLFDEIARRREENLRLVELRFEGGAENQGSVLLSRANHQEALLETFRVRQELSTARQTLHTLLGLEETLHFSHAQNAPLIPMPNKPPLQEFIVEHPELGQVNQRIVRSRAGVTQTRSAYFPTLDMQGGISRNDTIFFPERESWSVGLNLSIPLYQGGRNYARAQASLSELEQSLTQRQATTLSLRQELVDTYHSLLVQKQRVEVEQTFLEASRTRAEISRERYNSGLLSFEDWLSIENDYANRIRSSLNSEREFSIAQARWLYAIGTNSEEFVKGIQL